jgi:hypothetical protein
VGYDSPNRPKGDYQDFPAAYFKRLRFSKTIGPCDPYSPETSRLQTDLYCHLPFTFKGRLYTFKHVKPNQEEHNGK